MKRKNEALRFRQIHLDFHTNGSIPEIGKKFSRTQWQSALQAGKVNSVTTFARCHHGWCYYDTKVGKRHPHLDFDLLGEQIEASHEIGVLVPAYITVGWDELYAHSHQGELVIPPGKNFDVTVPGWKRLAFNTPYLDYVCALTEEVVANYDVDGVFFDIVGLTDDVSLFTQEQMRAVGMDPLNPGHRDQFARQVQEQYFQAANHAIHKIKPGLRVFHNAGHVPKGDRVFLKYASHLELESLPTGGWGYDHFPLSAKYAATISGVEFLGMTGKFHTTWGEFGGFKHPNALRYECASMIAYGARCSVGDQLHPSGEMNMDTYERIGIAYSEVEQKEPWCKGATPVSEIAFLSLETLPRRANEGEHFGGASFEADVGAARVLLERQVMFDVLDCDADFEKYRVLILPDEVRLEGDLLQKVRRFLKAGGKLLLTGDSGLASDSEEYAIPGIGRLSTIPDFDMEYIQIRPALKKLDSENRMVRSPFVLYGGNRRVKPEKGAEILADLIEPYFKRSLEHFCSHQHAPDARKSGFPAAFVTPEGNIAVIPPKIFTQYRDRASTFYRDLVVLVLQKLLEHPLSVRTNLQSAGRVSLMEQKKENRSVLHLLYGIPIKRGNNVFPAWHMKDVEVIEDLPLIANVAVTVRTRKPVRKVRMVPSGEPLEFTATAACEVAFTVPQIDCHQMIELCH